MITKNLVFVFTFFQIRVPCIIQYYQICHILESILTSAVWFEYQKAYHIDSVIRGRPFIRPLAIVNFFNRDFTKSVSNVLNVLPTYTYKKKYLLKAQTKNKKHLKSIRKLFLRGDYTPLQVQESCIILQLPSYKLGKTAKS